MLRFAPLCFLPLLLLQPAAPSKVTFAGVWETTYGTMTLAENDGKIEGGYQFGTSSTIAGKREGKRFTFTYTEPNARGEGWFEMADDGNSFKGKWRASGEAEWSDWEGKRKSTATSSVAGVQVSFAGLWDTSYGRMRLNQNGSKVTGSYSLAPGSKVEGTIADRKLAVNYEEPSLAKGVAEFTLSADGQAFTGRWHATGNEHWKPWTGRRVRPESGVIWLVVIEANWEGSLADPEYSFGSMLRAFFTRDPKVHVRQRFFTDEASLKRWLSEVAYLAEPVVISLSTHAGPDGLSAGGKTIGAAPIADSLKEAGNVKLLHFSSCLAMKGNLAEQIYARLGGARFPISGYTTSVDWGASAVMEFLYFDLLLCRRMSPATAVTQVKTLISIAGDHAPKASALPALGLRLVEPPPQTTAANVKPPE